MASWRENIILVSSWARQELSHVRPTCSPSLPELRVTDGALDKQLFVASPTPFSIRAFERTMTNYTTGALIARVAVLVSTVISFFCCTAVTGVSAGDYAFLVSFIALAYTLLHGYFVTYKKNVSFASMTQLILDGILAILLLAGALAVVASPWASWFGLSGAGTAAVIFLFFATAAQVVVIVMTLLSSKQSTQESSETPEGVYVAAPIPVADAPKSEVEQQV
ncbi:hypothetical protein AC1031_017699 [Aphanomyces cochlioides]|nr:hypothetical protein AC1031_017699 [Aphanomyces cochlioides]